MTHLQLFFGLSLFSKELRLLFLAQERPRAESESFPEKTGLDFSVLKGKIVIGEKTKYLKDDEGNLSSIKNINSAVLELLVRNEVEIRKTDRVKAAELKKQRTEYANTITDKILKVFSSLVHDGDSLELDGGKVTVIHKEKDNKEAKYEIDLAADDATVIEEARKNADIDRTRFSLEVLRSEVDREPGTIEERIGKLLEYERIFRSKSIVAVMNSLGGYDSSPAGRAAFWTKQMNEKLAYGASAKENLKMLRFLKKQTLESMGYDCNDLKEALKQEVGLTLGTLHEGLLDQYGTHDDLLPDDMFSEPRIGRVKEFIEGVGLKWNDYLDQVGETIDNALVDIIRGVKLPKLQQKLQGYDDYNDPLESAANFLLRDINKIRDNAKKIPLENALNDTLDTNRLRIAQAYVNDAISLIDGETAIRSEADYLDPVQYPEVQEAFDAVSKVNARKNTDKEAMKKSINDAITANILEVADVKISDAETTISSFNNLISFDDYFDGRFPEIDEAQKAIAQIVDTTVQSDRLNQLTKAVDYHMVDLANDRISWALGAISAINSFENISFYKNLPEVMEATKAVFLLDATRKATEKTAMNASIDAAIHDHIVENIEDAINDGTRQHAVDINVTDKTKPADDYLLNVPELKILVDTIDALDATVFAAEKVSLKAALKKKVEDKINTLP